MTDPLNRFYRYPAARALLPVLGRLPLTPNHVTYIHIAIGFAAAGVVWARPTPLALAAAFVLFELRMILDCFDGVLARARGASSPFGRALDEIADSVAFVSMVIAMGRHLYPAGGARTVLLGSVLLGMGGLCANAWDFYKRKITTALRDGADGVQQEIRQKQAMIERGDARPLAYWGVYFDSFQLWLYDVPARGGDPVAVIRANANDPAFRRFAALLSFLSFDNGLMVLHLGILTGLFLHSQLVAFAYAVVLWTFTMVLARRVLAAPRVARGLA